MNSKSVKLSICCLTYNHQDFIAKCLDGFLMQKTDFDFEILIHEDASTDKTASIIRSYQEKYPGRIDCVFQTENQFFKINALTDILFKKAQGDYIAFCDGDDYWTDPYKLQKQVDFLDNNPDYVIHSGLIKRLEGDKLIDYSLPEESYQEEDFYFKSPLYACTVVFRNRLIDYALPKDVQFGDWLLFLDLTHQSGLKAFRSEEFLSVYRSHNEGFTKKIDSDKLDKLHNAQIALIESAVGGFKISLKIKKRLTSFYLYMLKKSMKELNIKLILKYFVKILHPKIISELLSRI